MHVEIVQNVVLFGDKTFKEVITAKQSCLDDKRDRGAGMQEKAL